MDNRKRNQMTWSGVTLLVSLTAIAPSTLAQETVMPLSTPSPIAEQQAAADPTGSMSFGTSKALPISNDLRWGRVVFRPHASYRYLNSNGMHGSSGIARKTEIHTISPGIFASLGEHWTMDYTASWAYYSSSAFRDSLNQSAQLNWHTQQQGIGLSAGQTYNKSDSTLIETGRQTQQTSYNTNFNASFALSSRYSLSTSLSQNLNFSEGTTDRRTWTVGETLQNRISSRLNAGLGVTYSYTAIDQIPDISSLGFSGNMAYRLNDKLNCSLQAGLQKRRILNDAGDTQQSPFFSGSVQYAPTETTQLGLSASRSNSASNFSSQTIDTTSYTLSLGQRLLGRLQFSAGLSHRESEYTATQPPTLTGRVDKTDSFNLGLSTTFFARMRTSLTYQYSRNSTNAAEFEFTSNQIGLEVSYSF